MNINVKKWVYASAAGAVLALGVAGGAWAFGEGMFASVSGSQAAQVASQHIPNGVATDVDFDYDQHTGSRYEVDVRADGKQYEVLVDAKTGEVLASNEERDDERFDDEHDKHERGERHHHEKYEMMPSATDKAAASDVANLKVASDASASAASK
ncbi:MAG: PepSY domain-containing protein [Neisseria sp.]|nr:PepSY domain-containing protein [Neisseria sp.]